MAMALSMKAVLVTLLAMACVVSAFPFSKNSGVVELTPKTFNSFLNTHKPVFIMFYAPWCGHCKSLHPDYEKFGKSVKDVVRVGAINADQYREIGSQFGVQGFPTIKYWKMGSKKGMQPTDYAGQRSHGALHNAAVREISSSGVVTAVSVETVNKAIAKATERKAVLLFSAKPKSPPIFSVLSQSPHFKDKLGFVLVTEKAQELTKRFDVTNLPTIVVASTNQHGHFEHETYEGPVEYTAIAKFLQKTLGVEEGASEDATADAGAEKKKVADAPKPAPEAPKAPRPASPVRPLELTLEAFNTFCAHGAPKVRGQQPFCVISMKKESVNLEPVHAHFQNEAVHFFWLPDGARSAWMQDLQDGLQPRHDRLSPNDIIVLRAAKDRTKFAIWRHVPDEEHGHPDTFVIFLGKCLGGDLTFEKNPLFPVLRKV